MSQHQELTNAVRAALVALHNHLIAAYPKGTRVEFVFNVGQVVRSTGVVKGVTATATGGTINVAHDQAAPGSVHRIRNLKVEQITGVFINGMRK